MHELQRKSCKITSPSESKQSRCLSFAALHSPPGQKELLPVRVLDVTWLESVEPFRGRVLLHLLLPRGTHSSCHLKFLEEPCFCAIGFMSSLEPGCESSPQAACDGWF